MQKWKVNGCSVKRKRKSKQCTGIITHTKDEWIAHTCHIISTLGDTFKDDYDCVSHQRLWLRFALQRATILNTMTITWTRHWWSLRLEKDTTKCLLCWLTYHSNLVIIWFHQYKDIMLLYVVIFDDYWFKDDLLVMVRCWCFFSIDNWYLQMLALKFNPGNVAYKPA